MISLEEGAKKHEKLFPKADLLSQVYKLEEELEEVNQAECGTDNEKVIKEKADVIICCWGVRRFCKLLASKVYYSTLGASEERVAILEQAERKWKINEGRTWEFNGKVYKHVGKDGNE